MSEPEPRPDPVTTGFRAVVGGFLALVWIGLCGLALLVLLVIGGALCARASRADSKPMPIIQSGTR